MTSARDYNAIASILRANSAPSALILDMADYFEEDNPNFDRDKFIEAATDA